MVIKFFTLFNKGNASVYIRAPIPSTTATAKAAERISQSPVCPITVAKAVEQ
ncbi:hypothetical protein Hanom_Chr06g00490261 [Helianthus anomalus]